METYILNPIYYMMQDGNRVILSTKHYYEGSNFTTFIHPLNAQMLTFFNGEDSLEDIEKKVGYYFSLSPEDAKETLSRYIERERSFSIKYGANSMYFPANLIIKKGKLSRKDYNVYQVEDFPYKGEPDLNTMKTQVPLEINLLLTMKCYTDCVYCYANRKMNMPTTMSLEQILSIIEQAKSIGTQKLDINGGEVLLHPHYKEIISALIKNDYPPLVSTKVPIGEEQIQNLKEIGLKYIQVSLDSVNPQTLSKTLNVSDSYFGKIKKTLENLNEAGLEIHIHAVLTSNNSSLKEMEDLIEFAMSLPRVSRMEFSPAGFSIYKRGKYADFRPSKKFVNEFREYLKSIKEKYPKIRFNCSEGNIKESYCPDKRAGFFKERALCTGNLRAITILPDGRITICEELYEHPEFIIGDLTKQTLFDAWNSEKSWGLYRLKQSMIGEKSACKKCTDFELCRHNRGVCWKEILMAYGYDNWDYPDPRCPKAPEMYEDICLEE